MTAAEQPVTLTEQEIAALIAERDRLKRGGAELGKSLMFWMQLAKDVTDSDDCIDEDGDGDWGAVAERLAAMPARVQQARAEAWDQGWAALREFAGEDSPERPRNPYRANRDEADR